AVTAAPTAEEALDRIEADAFDLVVSDIKMPGLSGLDLRRAVKAKQPATPVVLITGAPSVNSAVFGLRHGAYDYLPKPFSIKEVQGLVERVRADRAKWNGQTPLPSGLAEELHRREAGVEMLLRLGDLALQGLEPQAFLEQTLRLARLAVNGGFLPDERDMLLGFAQTTSVALQKLVLRENLERHLVDTITAFVNAIESKDPYLKGHSARVALYAAEIASVMGLDDETIQVVSRGAMLHDLGKLSIMDTILRKPDRLTAEEFAIIKAHPVVGERILKPLRFLHREACCVRSHHERFDGSGYPDGLKGEDIPLLARIVTVADVFDAVTSNRPYRTALPVEAAREEIARGRGTHFDPPVADAFASIPLERLVEITRHYESLVSAPLRIGEGELARAS